MMMRKIAIGLAAATVAIGGPTLTASALQSQSMESGIISKGSASPSTNSHRFGPRTYGFYDEERGSGNRFSELTPLQRERLRGMVRERFSELTPLQRERINRFVLGRYERLSPLERERLYRHGAYGRR
jgi:hypothetical protein